MKRKLAMSIAILVGLVCSLTACGHDNLKDLKHVPNAHPDYILNVENMDQQPNVAMLCIHGAGFATTTRQYNALTRVPEWDAFCQTQQK